MALTTTEQRTYDRLLVKERDNRLTPAERTRLERLRARVNAETEAALTPPARPGTITETATSADRRASASAAPAATVVDLSNPDTVRFIQTVLANAGFYTGRIDGIWGPLTERAHNAWKSSQNAAAVQPVAPAANVADIATGGGGGGGGAPTLSTAAPLAPSAPTDVDTTIRERFPSFAPFMAIPEIAALLRASVSEGWPVEKLQTRLQGTEWWRSTNATKRAWMALEATDPASAARRLNESRTEIRNLANQYLMPLSNEGLDQWTRQVVTGDITPDDFRSYLVDQAKGKWGAIAGALDRGTTVVQFMEQYRQTAAQELGVPLEAVDLNDPKWRRPIEMSDGKGNQVPMTLYDWQSEIRKNPVYGWDRSINGRTMAAEFRTRLEETFGVSA